MWNQFSAPWWKGWLCSLVSSEPKLDSSPQVGKQPGGQRRGVWNVGEPFSDTHLCQADKMSSSLLELWFVVIGLLPHRHRYYLTPERNIHFVVMGTLLQQSEAHSMKTLTEGYKMTLDFLLCVCLHYLVSLGHPRKVIRRWATFPALAWVPLVSVIYFTAQAGYQHLKGCFCVLFRYVELDIWH